MLHQSVTSVSDCQEEGLCVYGYLCLPATRLSLSVCMCQVTEGSVRPRFLQTTWLKQSDWSLRAHSQTETRCHWSVSPLISCYLLISSLSSLSSSTYVSSLCIPVEPDCYWSRVLSYANNFIQLVCFCDLLSYLCDILQHVCDDCEQYLFISLHVWVFCLWRTFFIRLKLGTGKQNWTSIRPAAAAADCWWCWWLMLCAVLHLCQRRVIDTSSMYVRGEENLQVCELHCCHWCKKWCGLAVANISDYIVTLDRSLL